VFACRILANLLSGSLISILIVFIVISKKVRVVEGPST